MMMMKSRIVVLVLAFAALGLLLGFAESFDVIPLREPAFKTGADSPASSIEIGEEVSVTVKKADR